MSFSIDRQTIEELNLLGKFSKGSVFFLFNQVKTRNGEQLLNQLFRNPLDNATAINERSAIFRFFQEQALTFPFDVTQLTAMQEFLDTGTPGNALVTMADILIKKVLSGLTRDERYRKIVQGLQATIVVLKQCYTTARSLAAIPGPFQQRAKEVADILSERQLEALLNTDIYQSLPVGTLSGYNLLLKRYYSKQTAVILSFINELDVYIAVSNVARANNFSYSHALPAEENVLEANDLRHPCITKGVGNALSLQGHKNVLFLTGANMAGKSTLMKAVGINLYLSHMGFPVAATHLEFSVREGLYSSINVADNIHLGYSHFYGEVVRVKQAAEAAATGQRLLLMFDELFKGTNVKDAYDGTLAVTAAFAEYTDCLFIVSTHIIEVGVALQEYDNIQFAFLPTVMEGSIPRYTYKLTAGITEDRQGMMIIRNEGILELITS